MLTKLLSEAGPIKDEQILTLKKIMPQNLAAPRDPL